ncbi:MAG TPA: YicC/YloC family endoribonuclease [Treponemataceae bacterium]|nr:YicC/YloC family endoribonuclease [Treponemataceae bacterium]
MKSMTGYAYSEVADTDSTISVEMKSYNSRFLELSVNLPYWLSRLETRIREYAQKRILRGKVEISIRIREKSSKLQVTSDPEAARAYMGAVTEIADALGHTEIIPISLIIDQEGVLTSERSIDIEIYWNAILPILEKAFVDFEDSRLNEGKALKVDVIEMIDRIEEDTRVVSNWIPEMEKIFKENIKAKFEEMLGNNIDEQRVMQETAALLMKYTINEEVVRLRAHLTSLRKEIEENPAPGRKADFICQEINREVNTIGSKNQILEVGQSVIDAKDALENIREQMRNIE